MNGVWSELGLGCICHAYRDVSVRADLLFLFLFFLKAASDQNRAHAPSRQVSDVQGPDRGRGKISGVA